MKVQRFAFAAGAVLPESLCPHLVLLSRQYPKLSVQQFVTYYLTPRNLGSFVSASPTARANEIMATL